MKKLICALLALLLCAALLAGCGGKSAGSVSSAFPAEKAALLTDRPAAPSVGNERVFYEIFVGSFSDSDGDGSGDLRGIINRMDYLNDGDADSGKSLGVEGLWLTPIFASPSYHKYDVTDYYAIDPAFGTLDDLRELCALCHERGVLVILDLPINHTGSRNEWFKNFCEAHRSGDESSEWYGFYSFCRKGEEPEGRRFRQIDGCGDMYECNFSDDMPELDLDNEAVRAEVLKVARFYLELGVDGFRFDAIKYADFGDHPSSAAFWEWYMDELRAIRSDVYAVGECWDDDSVILQYYGSMNCFCFSVSQSSGYIAEAASGGEVRPYTDYVESWYGRVRAIRPDASYVPFVTNHDMDRAAGMLGTANGRMQMAANLYILGPGSPFIYYGEELGLRGSRGGSGTDANRRLAMPWGDGDKVADPEGADYDKADRVPADAAAQQSDPNSLYNYYRGLIAIRRANPEIAGGECVSLDLGDSPLGGFVFTADSGAVCVIHNTGHETRTVELSALGGREFTVLAACAGLGEAKLEGGVLTLGPRTSVVLREG